MPDITLAATITRDNLEVPLLALDINDEDNYIVGRSLQIASVSYRRTTVTSPWVGGRFVTNSVVDSVESAIEVYVIGSSYGNLMTNLSTLLDAFTQPEFDLTLVIDGTTHTWTCEGADYEIGFITETIATRFMPTRFTFHRNPVPVAGVI